MDKKIILGVVVLLLLIVGVVVIQNQNPTGLFGATQNSVDEVKIGASLSLSGVYAYKSVPFQNGLILAQKEINDNGGILDNKLKLIIEDNKVDSKEASINAEKLINVDKVDLIISHFTSIAGAISPIAEANNKFFIYQSITPKFAEKNKYVFKDYYSVADVGKEYIKTLRQKTKVKKIGLLVSNNDVIDTFLNSIKSEIGDDFEIVDIEIHEITAKDFRSNVLKLKESGAEAVLFATTATPQCQFVKQMTELNYNATLLLLEGPVKEMSDPSCEVGLEENQTFGHWFKINDTSKEYLEFKEKYFKEFGVNPTPESVFAYDELMFLKEVITSCGQKGELHSSDCYIEEAAGKSYTGLSGAVNFDSNGVGNKAIKIVEYNNGKWTDVN